MLLQNVDPYLIQNMDGWMDKWIKSIEMEQKKETTLHFFHYYNEKTLNEKTKQNKTKQAKQIVYNNANLPNLRKKLLSHTLHKHIHTITKV